MTTRRSRPRGARRGTGQRRPVTWEQSIFLNTLLPSGAIVANDLTPDPLRSVAAHRGSTATLRRMLIHFDLGQLDAQGSLEAAAFGIYVASHEALDQSALNDPNADAGQDWYYWTSRTARLLTAADNAEMVSWDADIRSQRKLRGGYDLVLVSSALASNVVSLLSHISVRALWSIP